MLAVEEAVRGAKRTLDGLARRAAPGASDPPGDDRPEHAADRAEPAQ
jgi:hypothetical protein